MAGKKGKSNSPQVSALGSPGKDFTVAALNMSWQLAIVVLVPILGGFYLDGFLGSLPALTAVGFFVAMAGMAWVIWRQLQLFQPPKITKTKAKKQ